MGPSNIGQATMSVTRIAIMPPINTVGQPGPVMAPPCAHKSPILAAGIPGILDSPSHIPDFYLSHLTNLFTGLIRRIGAGGIFILLLSHV
jgi:hypothetical protein